MLTTRRIVTLATLCAIALVAPLAGQRPSAWLDASVGAGSGAQRVAASAWRPVVTLAGRVHLGFGARVSAYAGDPTDYTNRGTVQGNLTSKFTIDPAVYAINAGVFGELSLGGPVAVGANLDLLGWATGPTRTAGALVAKPQAGSYFQYGSADHGALNSEFFASLRVAPRVRVRVGLSHYVTDYTVTDTAAAAAPSSRYQRFETTPFVAVAVRL